MPPDDSRTTSKDDRSQPTEWLAEERWAEMTLPSHLRNMSPSQRKSQAGALRLLRRGNFLVVQWVSMKTR